MSLANKNVGWRPHEIQAALNSYLAGFEFIKPLTKRQRILASLVVISLRKRPITRFDSEAVGDHCLNSTISQISHTDGIPVSRRGVKRPTRFGLDADCLEYWLEPDSIAKAEALLIGLTNFAAA